MLRPLALLLCTPALLAAQAVPAARPAAPALTAPSIAQRWDRAFFAWEAGRYPEALSGELVHEQADVFSLATIAYHMLTNVLPFAGKTPRELFQQLLTQPAIPLNQAVKGLTFADELAAVVMKGLARDLGERWKTVEEFAGAFVAAARVEGAQRKKGFLASIFGKGE